MPHQVTSLSGDLKKACSVNNPFLSYLLVDVSSWNDLVGIQRCPDDSGWAGSVAVFSACVMSAKKMCEQQFQKSNLKATQTPSARGLATEADNLPGEWDASVQHALE